jgi:hypothetical protein
MRAILILWAVPMGLFWGWYFLSLNDINFGFLFLSRAVHEVVFELYGQILGIDPAGIPGMVARACVFDTLLIAAIIAFRRRVGIIAWVRAWKTRNAQEVPAAPNA